MTQLQAFAFGRLCRDATFSAEVSFSGDWDIECDVEKREVKLYMFDDMTIAGTWIAEHQVSC
jgi:hypothetical protein